MEEAAPRNPQTRDWGAVQSACAEIFQLHLLVFSDGEALCSPSELRPEEMI